MVALFKILEAERRVDFMRGVLSYLTQKKAHKITGLAFKFLLELKKDNVSLSDKDMAYLRSLMEKEDLKSIEQFFSPLLNNLALNSKD